MYLNKTCNKVHMCKHVMHFLFRMAWNKKMLYHHCFSTFL